MSGNNENLKPIEIIDAVDNDTQRKIEEFYSSCPEKTLKTLVLKGYYESKEEFIVIVLSGACRTNLSKIKSNLGLKKIRFANQGELRDLGLVPGYVSPIDCSIKGMKIIGDLSITKNFSYYDGGNKERTYRKNVNFPRDFDVWKLFDIAE